MSDYTLFYPLPPVQPTPPDTRSPGRARIPVIVLAIVVAGLASFGTYSLVEAHHEINQLRRQVTQVQSLAQDATTASNEAQSSATQATSAASQAQATATKAQDTASQAENTLATLSTPTDPLSSYDLICTSQNTNSVTGITQTYYYACTNVATTTPQPGA